MSEYQAPLQDMQFVLRELAALQSLQQLSAFSDVSADVIDAALTEAGRFAAEVLSPLNQVGDNHPAQVQDRSVIESEGFAPAYQQLVAAGWAGINGDPAYGGSGFPETAATAVGEMWASANLSFSLCPMLTQGAIGAISAHGSEALQQRFLEPMISGRWAGTMNLTEPQAGSDLAAVRTRAVKDGDVYRITGNKIYITWGDHRMTENIVHLVLARTPDAPPGVKGISMFIVPKFLVNDDGSLGARNDVYASSVEHKMGIHASPTCVMNYGDSGGAIAYLVGQENQGLVYMFTMMNHARLHVGVQGVAMSERAYQRAAQYAKERIQGVAAGYQERGPIIRHADVRRMLMLMRALTEASRALTYITAAELDRAHHHDDPQQREEAKARLELLTPIAKAWPTELAQEVTALGVQVHGGMGFVEETGAAQYVRDARIITIYEGTTGIQANDLIGRKLISNGGLALKQLIEQMNETCRVLAEHSQWQQEAARLSEAVAQLQITADWIISNASKDPAQAGASAVNFLMQAGTVVGGWLMAKSILAAIDGQGDKDFLQAKMLTAQFYLLQVLPRAQSYRDAVMTPSQLVTAMKESWF